MNDPYGITPRTEANFTAWNAAVTRARADYGRAPFERLIDNQKSARADGLTYRETRASRAKDAQAARDRKKAS